MFWRRQYSPSTLHTLRNILHNIRYFCKSICSCRADSINCLFDVESLPLSATLCAISFHPGYGNICLCVSVKIHFIQLAGDNFRLTKLVFRFSNASSDEMHTNTSEMRPASVLNIDQIVINAIEKSVRKREMHSKKNWREAIFSVKKGHN